MQKNRPYIYRKVFSADLRKLETAAKHGMGQISCILCKCN